MAADISSGCPGSSRSYCSERVNHNLIKTYIENKQTLYIKEITMTIN